MLFIELRLSMCECEVRVHPSIRCCFVIFDILVLSPPISKFQNCAIYNDD